MKVALCFSGYPMFIKQHKECWLEFIDKYQADVYASLWEGGQTYYDKRYPSQEEDTVDYFKNIYKPKSIEVENPEIFNKSFRFLGEEYASNPKPHEEFAPQQSQKDFEGHTKGQSYSCFYKIWRANQLCLSSEKEYDVIIRAETCSSYPELTIVKENNISIPAYLVAMEWSEWGESKVYQQYGFWQHLAFGPPDLMTYYSSIVFYLRKYYDESIVFPTESLFNYHLSRRPDIEIRLFRSAVKRKTDYHTTGKEQKVKSFPSSELHLYQQSENPNAKNTIVSSLEELGFHEDIVHKMHSKTLFKAQV